jgi:hypothetical protein
MHAQPVEERPPDRAFPIVLQMGQEMPGAQERRAIAGSGEGDTRAVGRARDSDTLGGGRGRRRRGGRRLAAHHLDRRQEPVAAARHRFQHRLNLAAVAQGAAQGGDARGDRRLRDDAPAPDLIDDPVVADQFARVANEQRRQLEHLRLHRHALAAPAEHMRQQIQFAIGKAIQHGPNIASHGRLRATIVGPGG